MTSSNVPSAVWPEDNQTAVLLDRGAFSWQGPRGTAEAQDGGAPPSGHALLLHNLNLNIKKVPGRKSSERPLGCVAHGMTTTAPACVFQGTLTVVVGKVGCGKSSLLAAITGELDR